MNTEIKKLEIKKLELELAIKKLELEIETYKQGSSNNTNHNQYHTTDKYRRPEICNNTSNQRYQPWRR